MNMYLFAAYSLIMAFILCYVGTLHGRIRKLGEELQHLRDEIDSPDTSSREDS